MRKTYNEALKVAAAKQEKRPDRPWSECLFATANEMRSRNELCASDVTMLELKAMNAADSEAREAGLQAPFADFGI